MTAAAIPASPVSHAVVGEYRVVLLPDGLAHVSSKSQPGMYHEVTPAGRCTCKGFTYRNRCSHRDAARIARGMRTPDPRCSCGEPWTVHLYGADEGYYCGACSPVR